MGLLYLFTSSRHEEANGSFSRLKASPRGNETQSGRFPHKLAVPFHDSNVIYS